MVGVFRPDEGKIGRMASRKRGASKTTQMKVCMAEGDVINVLFGSRKENHADVSIRAAEKDMTISCLLGAQTCRKNNRWKEEELMPYATALEEEKIPQGRKSVFVVLFLEGNFESDVRKKLATMQRIQESIEKKLKWLNCKVSVVDASTYRSKLFEVERMA